MKLDVLNKKILASLSIDCRQPYSKVAHELRTSREVLAYRIKTMLEEKAINGFTMALNYKKLGYMVFKVYVHFKDLDERSLDSFTAFLREQSKVNYCVALLGNYDLCLTFTCQKADELEEFLDAINQKFSRIISKKSIVIVTSQDIFPEAKFLLRSEKNSMVPIAKPQLDASAELDQKDFEVLNSLISNSTMTLKDLHGKTGIAIDTLKERIRELRKNNIIPYFKASINYAALGWKHFDMLLKTKPSVNAQKSRFFQFARDHPHITYVSRTIGAYDFEFHIIAESSDEFEKVLRDIREKFGENIESYVTSEITHKVKVFPIAFKP